MRLRARLIVAFLVMSVVPLTLVTLYSYTSSVRAFQRTVEAEAGAMAAEMGYRMELVTEDLGRRVDQLWDVPATAPAAETDEAQAAQHLARGFAVVLGETAHLLERVEFIPSPAETPAAPGDPPPAPRGPGDPPPAIGLPAVPAGRLTVNLPSLLADLRTGDLPIPDEAVEQTAEWLKHLEIQLATGLGMGARGAAAGIRLGAEHLSRLAEAHRRATERRSAIVKGKDVDFAVWRSGRVVGTVSARLNLERMLHTVFAMTRADQGEIPFAIDQERRIYSPGPENRRTLEALGLGEAAAAGRARGDGRHWVVVTREDPAGVTFGIARPIGESLAEMRAAAVRSLGLGLLVIGLAVVAAAPLSRRMTRNLSTLTDGVNRIAGGDLSTRVPVRSRDEFGDLARAFNQMAQDIEAHQKRLIEQERLQRELELCRQIQIEMLPREPLRLELAEIKGVSIPAREVGGDFFNYFPLASGDIALLVGDVSGKGVGAALLMANVQATLQARLPLEPDLRRLADAIDREIERTTPRGVYVTLFIGILDPVRKVLRYVNAGHNPQFVLRADGGLERLGSTGLPIGMFAGHGYREQAVALGDGDLLFFYTDGTVETENEAGQMFGAERLEDLVLAAHQEGVEVVLERVERELRSFRGTAEPFDDATMMALRVGASVVAAVA